MKKSDVFFRDEIDEAFDLAEPFDLGGAGDAVPHTPHRRGKSRKKGMKRADHRHTYEPCVFTYHGLKLDRGHGFVQDTEFRYMIGSYCSVCGRIQTRRHVRSLTEEMRGLPTFYLDDTSKKCIELPG